MDTAAQRFRRRRKTMFTAVMNALAILRLGAFRVMRGSSDAAGIVVAILIGAAAVIWAISQADGRESAKN